tara:strand:- start:344 stop:979 length:636 start_codon:yes stop_codon:yes gene_type:complete
MELNDTRFLDTLQESTTFYFDIFNFDGYDRFGNTIFEDLKYRLTSRSSIEFPETKIASFEGAMFRKGLHTKYVVYGIYKNEPDLIKQNDSLTLITVGIEFKPEEVNVPESVNLLIASKTAKTTNEKKTLDDLAQDEKKSEKARDNRLIIIACFRESYFDESMLSNFDNKLSDIDFYIANGWVRIYLVDFPGYRIYEALEVFPDAWRANYGE